jgi:hypothetical protein
MEFESTITSVDKEKIVTEISLEDHMRINH